ncbi:hypothetical protein [Lentzea sp. NPDC051838]|uniref:hypothetical protein n=1 Tax=Lentzea sp. NPDC051838 TaxID=3154849 RepID=UPI003449F60E
MEEVNNSVAGSEIGAVVQVGHATTVNVHGSATPRTSPLGRPVATCSPLDLEVHSAGDGPLPPYIRRSHDAVLDSAVRAAFAGTSAMSVLVGGSSTGKTRACWEAVRTLPAPWRLWHPISPGRPQAVLADLGHLQPHTVLWLNESHHYLLTPGSVLGEQVAAGLRELLRSASPVLVLGTLWPEYWQTLTREPGPAEPDPHAQARALLVGTGTRVADEFTAADVAAAAATAEPRLVEAAARARDRQVTQYLAGAPALLERFRTAPPAEEAIITAAMDIRRLGHGLVMSADLLKDAAPGYLTDSQWNKLGDNWFADALAACVHPGPGGSSPLAHVRPRPGRTTAEGYQLEDYLEQRSRLTRSATTVPATTWSALLSRSAPEDHLVLATAARVRGLYRIAHHFYLKANAPRYVYDMLITCGRGEDAAAWARRTGGHDVRPRLAAGDPAAVETFQQAAASAFALRIRAEQLLRGGRADEALRALDHRAETGDRTARVMAELLRIKLGSRTPPEPVQVPTELDWMGDPDVVVRAAAELGDWSAVRKIAGTMLAEGERDHLITWLRGIAIRQSMTPENLLFVLRGDGPPGETPTPRPPEPDWEPDTVFSRLVRASQNNDEYEYGEAFARLRALPFALQQAGRLDEALEWHVLLIETGNGNRIRAAEGVLRLLGRPEEADRLKAFGLDPGGRFAGPWP